MTIFINHVNTKYASNNNAIANTPSIYSEIQIKVNVYIRI